MTLKLSNMLGKMAANSVFLSNPFQWCHTSKGTSIQRRWGLQTPPSPQLVGVAYPSPLTPLCWATTLEYHWLSWEPRLAREVALTVSQREVQHVVLERQLLSSWVLSPRGMIVYLLACPGNGYSFTPVHPDQVGLTRNTYLLLISCLFWVCLWFQCI